MLLNAQLTKYGVFERQGSPSQRINDEWHDVWICVNRKENCKIVT